MIHEKTGPVKTKAMGPQALSNEMLASVQSNTSLLVVEIGPKVFQTQDCVIE